TFPSHATQCLTLPGMPAAANPHNSQAGNRGQADRREASLHPLLNSLRTRRFPNTHGPGYSTPGEHSNNRRCKDVPP
ncbi:hypothetical protein, partial [Chlamydia psittaci]|uniref:hypothetical protein n=1 Tax=Chlamydia psittaci TaxID=83554 RepID=UPI001E4A4BEA